MVSTTVLVELKREDDKMFKRKMHTYKGCALNYAKTCQIPKGGSSPGYHPKASLAILINFAKDTQDVDVQYLETGDIFAEGETLARDRDMLQKWKHVGVNIDNDDDVEYHNVVISSRLSTNADASAAQIGGEGSRAASRGTKKKSGERGGKKDGRRRR